MDEWQISRVVGCRVAEWLSGRLAELKSTKWQISRVEGCRVAEWLSGRLAELKEWQNG